MGRDSHSEQSNKLQSSSCFCQLMANELLIILVNYNTFRAVCFYRLLLHTWHWFSPNKQCTGAGKRENLSPTISCHISKDSVLLTACYFCKHVPARLEVVLKLLGC